MSGIVGEEGFYCSVPHLNSAANHDQAQVNIKIGAWDCTDSSYSTGTSNLSFELNLYAMYCTVEFKDRTLLDHKPQPVPKLV